MAKRIRRRVKKNSLFKKVAMTGIGYFIARCSEEYKEIEDVVSLMKGAREVAYQESNNDKAGCSPCDICTVKMELITKILNDADIPHVDDEGTVLDTFDRISIYMAVNGKSDEEELN